MIAHLSGQLLDREATGTIILQVNQIGYEIFTSMNTVCHLNELGQSYNLWIQPIIREDAQLLYGFYTREEKQLFRLLIKVSGVGPKTAMMILSGISVEEFYSVLQQEDALRLAKVPGIGKKTAERIIVELKDQVKKYLPVITPVPASDQLGDAIAGLISLGYKPQDAEKMIRQLNQDNCSTDELIRLALQKAMR